MSYGDGTERLDDDELIYRRVLASHGLFNSETGKLSPEAFRPFKYDETGISVDRAKYCTVREAAEGRNPKGYFVAVLRVGDIRRAGLEVVPRPVAGKPGHAEMPALNYADRRSAETQQRKLLLARQLTLRVEGPFIRAEA